MSEVVYYDIHGLVGISLDGRVSDWIVRDIDFQIAHFKRPYLSRRPGISEIRIYPYNDYAELAGKALEKFHDARGLRGVLLDNSERRLAVTKLNEGFAVFADTPNFLITLYIQLLLCHSGYSMVHAAAVMDENGAVTLFTGAGGVGKTALVGKLVKEHGYKCLGDDIVLLSQDGMCRSFPRSFVLKEYHRQVFGDVFKSRNIRRGVSHKLKRAIVDNAPFVGLLKKALRGSRIYSAIGMAVNRNEYEACVPMESILGRGKIAEIGPVERIVLLTRYLGDEYKRETTSGASLARIMLAILHREWSSSLDHVFALGALELVDVPSYFERTVRIIQSCIGDKRREILYIPESAQPDSLVSAIYGIEGM